MNYYTSNLNFDPGSFVFTGTREERSKLSREDSVTNVKTVIASDMGLRYIFRNDLLTTWDDARAELRYQMEQSPGEVDDIKLLEVLLAAQSACEKWFWLIDEKDVLVVFVESHSVHHLVCIFLHGLSEGFTVDIVILGAHVPGQAYHLQPCRIYFEREKMRKQTVIIDTLFEKLQNK